MVGNLYSSHISSTIDVSRLTKNAFGYPTLYVPLPLNDNVMECSLLQSSCFICKRQFTAFEIILLVQFVCPASGLVNICTVISQLVFCMDDLRIQPNGTVKLNFNSTLESASRENEVLLT